MLSMKKILILIFFFICAASVYAGAPSEIRYNGKLKTYGSDANGSKNMNFLIFDGLTGGSLLWQSGSQSVSVSSGIFSYVMQPSNVNWQVKDCYLEVVIDGKVMTPREKLTSVPYAIHADNGLVKGMIIMWYGEESAIPDGWALCDGQVHNGVQTPDLRDRFIVGAGSSYNLNDTGGESTHTLTIAEMPSHSHRFWRKNNGGAYGDGEGTNYSGQSGQYSDEWVGVKTIENTGGSQPHNNMPPYYALYYIMRVK
jgi:microcystin-dependent protein